MKASVGDQLVVHGVHVDDAGRDGEILEVHGADGGPPYVVRWSDNGHETLFFPGPDASVRHFEHAEPAATYEVRTVRLQRQPIVVVKAPVPVDGIPAFMATAFDRVGKALADAGTQPAGPPIGRYEMNEDTFVVEAGFPVRAPLPPADGVENAELPGGLTARTLHVGSYEALAAAYHALEDWAVDNGYQVRDLPWESYLDEPDVPAPRTAVYLPLDEPNAG